MFLDKRIKNIHQNANKLGINFYVFSVPLYLYTDEQISTDGGTHHFYLLYPNTKKNTLKTKNKSNEDHNSIWQMVGHPKVGLLH